MSGMAETSLLALALWAGAGVIAHQAQLAAELARIEELRGEPFDG